jgi:hypothetical protein
MPGGPFRLQPGPEGPTYEGPHGPMTIHNRAAGDGTTVDTAAGRAHVDWDMTRRDREALDAGVAISLGGVSGRLRREGKVLVLDGPDGHMATVRPKAFGRWIVEDARGEEQVRVKPKLAGDVREGAAAEHVTLAVLVMASGALPRGGGGALTPFG